MPSKVVLYGNLQAYRAYVLPKAKDLFGSYSFRKKSTTKHHQNVQKMLEILALNGPMTTWAMAKTIYVDDTSNIRTKEKEYRRLLKGRKDRGKHSPGVLDLAIVVMDGQNYNRGPSDTYRLSLHGVLYCLDVLGLTNREIDMMAKKYANILPLVFGKWDHLKSIIGDDVYRIKTLASGIMMDNIQVTKMTAFPVFELLSYLTIKYQDSFESIEETDFADQVSYWAYTHLLIPSGKSGNQEGRLRKIFEDRQIKRWYRGFIEESKVFYKDRFATIRKIGL